MTEFWRQTGAALHIQQQIPLTAPEYIPKQESSTEFVPKVHQMLACNICGDNFENRSKLERHQLKHSNVRNFECNICKKLFKNTSNLGQHKRTHESGPFECKYCLLLFIKRRECEVHRRTCTSRPKPLQPIEKKQYKCPIESCPKIYFKNSHLKRHLASTHLNKRQFKCDYQGCGKGFNDISGLGLHKKIVHLKIREAQCQICLAKFYFKHLLERHMRIFHDESRNRFACDYCGITFHLKTGILKHIRTVHTVVPSGSCVCEHCGRIFSNSSIQDHINNIHLNTRSKDFMCTICYVSFTTDQKLQNHIEKRHVEERNFECPLCEKKFKAKADLMQHKQTHVLEPLQCSYCFEIQKSQEIFNSHLDCCSKKHGRVTKKKKLEYICDVCNRVFTKLSNLKRHKSGVHENRRDYQCDYPKCGKLFNDVGNMRKHKRNVHMKVGKVECHLCWKKFPFKSTLDAHVKQHEGYGKKPSCDLCGVAFDSKSKLTAHMRYQHLRKADWEKNYLNYSQDASDSNGEEFIKEENVSDAEGYDEDFAWPSNENEFWGAEDTEPNLKYVKKEPIETVDVDALPMQPINEVDIKIEVKEEAEDLFEEIEQVDELDDDNSVINSSESDSDYETVDKKHRKKSKLETSHPPNKKFKCNLCEKFYRKQHELDKHVRYFHDGIKDFVCMEENCGKTFAYEKSLKHHIAIHHSNETGYKLSCDQCTKVFNDKDGLRKHKQSFHEGIKYPCPHCDTQVSRKNDLKKHIERRHINPKPVVPKLDKHAK